MLRGEAELAEPWAKQLCLGLGLIFLGKQGAVDATIEVCTSDSPQSAECCRAGLLW
jgi:26S proteasome regulatory subunit N1